MRKFEEKKRCRLSDVSKTLQHLSLSQSFSSSLGIFEALKNTGVEPQSPDGVLEMKAFVRLRRYIFCASCSARHLLHTKPYQTLPLQLFVPHSVLDQRQFKMRLGLFLEG